MSKILYLLEMMNGAEGISDIEGKATRVGASERGQRMSFKPRFYLVLQRYAASRALPGRKAQMSGCELSTKKNGNGGWSSFPGWKEWKNRFPIACQG